MQSIEILNYKENLLLELKFLFFSLPGGLSTFFLNKLFQEIQEIEFLIKDQPKSV